MSLGPKTLILHRSWSGPKEVKELDTPKHSNKKNTKKWCKGKVGREHVTEWKLACDVLRYRSVTTEKDRESYRQSKWATEIQVCTTCEKHLKWRKYDKDNNNQPTS